MTQRRIDDPDAGLILAAQKVEHYEIGTYGTLRTFASCMGHSDVQNLLQQTLDNEKETDVALTKVAGRFDQCACRPQE
jgi:ferritin-like metal-binding protein YciE